MKTPGYRNRRRHVLQAGGALVLAGLVPAARAQQRLPTGTIRILVGFPPGGGSDIMARQIAEKLRERTSANVIVENRVGASGALAIDALRKAPADGTVLMYGTSATTVALTVTRKAPGFDLDKDLTPIALTGATATCYVLSSTLGLKTLGDYVAWLKKNPGKNSFGTTAPGSNTHFFGVLLGQAIGIPLEAAGYKGAAPLLVDLYGGHVPAGCGGVTDFLTQHQADKVRIVCVSSPRRLPFAPDLPTVSELGYPSLNYEGFYGFYGPPKMSPAIIDAWNRELSAATESSDLRTKLLNTGLDVQTSTPAEFASRQAKLVVSFTEMMRNAGYSPE